MRIFVDQEGKQALEWLLDVALKTQGLNAYQNIKGIEQSVQLLEDPNGMQKQENRNKEEAERQEKEVV